MTTTDEPDQERVQYMISTEDRGDYVQSDYAQF